MDKVFRGIPYALAIMLTTSFTKGFCTFTDRYSFLHPYRRTTSIYRWTIGLPSVPTVPMDKVFRGLPYALPIMLTTSFTKGFCTFTDRVFISPSVPTDTDGRNNFTKLTVGMLASVLDNPRHLNTYMSQNFHILSLCK